MLIPQVLNNFNVYNGNNNEKLIGVGDEVTLPDLTSVTSSLTGAGMLGSIDVPVLGHFDSLELDLPFKNFTEGNSSVMVVGEMVYIILRGSLQVTNSSTGNIEFQPARVSVKGYLKKIAAGRYKVADTMESSLGIEVNYLHITANNKTLVKLDKLNCVYELNGSDQISKITKQC